MNNLIIAGNIGKDAELRQTQNGKQVCGFSVAVSGRKDDPATWFDCSIWGERAAKVAPYIRKGDRITVSGEVSAREHNGKAYLQVFVKDFTFQGGKSEGGTGTGQDGYSQPGPADMDDEIPW